MFKGLETWKRQWVWVLFAGLLGLLALEGLPASAEEEEAYLLEPDAPGDISMQATHVDSGKIAVPGINAFAVDGEGRILAACGANPGEIKILGPDGEEIRSWKVDFKPEAIGAAPGGEVLVGGEGKLRCFDIEGKLLLSADSPQAVAMRENAGDLRETAIQSLKGGDPDQLVATAEHYKGMIKELEAKRETQKLNPEEEQILQILPQHIQTMEAHAEELKKRLAESPDPKEEDIQAFIENAMRNKMRIASISGDGEHVFIATPAATGYGYAVWKMKPDFTAGEEIVTGLRGCCGQMDVQCCENGVYVAENSRHRVVCFDKNGEEKLAWGKGDRKGIDGFSSCCNPMNVCFGADGDVYTAESTTGRIKRFDKDGNLLNFVGDVKLVPGCKNVSIAVAPDGERIYMLDITRGHIVVMTKAPAEEPVKGE